MLNVDPHPLLDLRAFVTDFPRPLGEMAAPPDILSLFSLTATAPLKSDDTVRQAVRQLLREGGFKPTGRSKPASEYLVKAVEEGRLGPINLAVDVCNAVSLHSGLPISVVDLDLAKPPMRVGVAGTGTSYVFNPTGQSIDLGGLLCLFDAQGPCANAVKDAQRTKTSAATRKTFTVIWGTKDLEGRADGCRGVVSAVVGASGGGLFVTDQRLIKLGPRGDSLGSVMSVDGSFLPDVPRLICRLTPKAGHSIVTQSGKTNKQSILLQASEGKWDCADQYFNVSRR